MLALLGPVVILNTMQYRAGVNLRRQIPNIFYLFLSSVKHYTSATISTTEQLIYLSLSLNPRMFWKGDGDGGIITQLPLSLSLLYI